MTQPAENPTPDEADAGARRRFNFSPDRRPAAAAAAAAGARYSRFVGMMKFMLPMLALGLVVAVVVWPGAFQEQGQFQLSFASFERGEAERLTMVSPRYLGTDSNNQPFVVTAAMAEQDPGDTRRVSLTAIQADMTFENGTWFTMMADAGQYHQGEQTLDLSGQINIFSDSGYELHTEAAHIDLASGQASTSNEVRGQGPFGTLRADRMEAEQRGQVLRFIGNVRLVIAPTARGQG